MEIKELNCYSIGGNIYDGTYWLSLFNEDEQGNESDTVVIKFDQKRMDGFIKALSRITELRKENK